MANSESNSSIGIKPLENRIASVFIHVTDLRKSAEWYSRLLGLPLMEDRLSGGPVYWFDFKGTHLILDSNAVNRQNPEWNESMMPRIMFNAADIDEAFRYVCEKGDVLSEPERHGAMAYFNFRDPEGNVHMACWSSEADEGQQWASQSPIFPQIGGVFVDVKNMHSSALWYSELLGAQWHDAAAEQDIYSVPMVSGAALLLDRNRYLNQETFKEVLYFETGDFEAAIAYVRSHGFEMAGEVNDFPDLSEFALLDPDGNRILIAYMK
ncbi:VOC family protein [Paenibacillus chibensis]|uniref:VOC family protein n=1 Tax=Paenibacillus chibensis TaxID=59846 RepID=UPI000FD953F0|nr:VOC family protein [Paenibacillus chibensis]